MPALRELGFTVDENQTCAQVRPTAPVQQDRWRTVRDQRWIDWLFWPAAWFGYGGAVTFGVTTVML